MHIDWKSVEHQIPAPAGRGDGPQRHDAVEGQLRCVTIDFSPSHLSVSPCLHPTNWPR